MKAKLILNYAKTKDIYSDGDVEKEILGIFKGKDRINIISKILTNNPTWPMRYHLSPIRKNILNWYDFKKKGSLLEIGAGCGAITEVFCKKLNKVIAIELSKLRSEIIANRHNDYKNLTVIAGNLNDIKIDEKFDYVTLIGVLEYAGKYTHTNNPFVDFLKNAKTYLKKNGTLIIAIENKFGLKYWAGCNEDHTGVIFDSIENYSNDKGVKTFSKDELKKVIQEAGFTKTEFYYPYPDYKLPDEIFSDNYLPTQNHNINSHIFPFKDYAQNRECLFNEKLTMDNIVENQKSDFFSNSFLVFAQ